MSEGVTVLGVNDGHNAGAALIKDGKVLAAIQEERLRNIKNYSGVPGLAIKKVFEISRLSPSELDIIAIVSLNRTYAPLKETPLKVKLFEKLSPFVHSHAFSKFYVNLLHRFRSMKELNNVFKELDILEKETVFIEHHLAHAACAYYQRPWDGETLILTLDGAGDGLSATVNIGDNFDIDRIASSTYYDSLGNAFYSEITAYLGLKRWEHEFKCMGMAPYGKAEYCLDKMRRLIRINPKKPLEFQNISRACNTQVQKKLRKLLAGQRFDNIAAAAQRHFEDLVVQWVKNCIEETGIHSLACSGGSFLNVKANKLIREMGEVEEAFFYPASDDGGTPVGAALEAYYRFCEREGTKPEKHELRDLYFGNEFGNEDIKHVLKDRGWFEKAEYLDEIDIEVANLVSKGKIIARFNGRGEWGPRALGSRSILADPHDLKVIRKLNFAIKMRDFWMPFAPSILESRMNDYLMGAKPARYMIEAFDTTEKAKDIIAGLHPYDRTARPQTVNDWDPGYRRLLEEFEDLTGIGGILNTSFNLHGWPIVGSPEQALWTFENSGLDGVAIGNYLVTK
jgi:carbamoyltransferase